ncbi:MAG: hypothetical protein HC887_11865 [Desulfobacteraceae bacterium]|nr:hypothetical protein [Desulfobacteraceae bacterium]
MFKAFFHSHDIFKQNRIGLGQIGFLKNIFGIAILFKMLVKSPLKLGQGIRRIGFGSGIDNIDQKISLCFEIQGIGNIVESRIGQIGNLFLYFLFVLLGERFD